MVQIIVIMEERKAELIQRIAILSTQTSSNMTGTLQLIREAATEL